ncbi:MAG: nitrous oxide reductase accessory protein NosL [Rhodospirillum sp.]|nr:nitrous oxide reductase accessory protein NosL [Rhodospirillum sp.]MCF8488387.1 nitrous oxide reductase accessory protein NosL [Rhodospirillum sp.]MCF8502445.1 nitrous oxide reductase accessory protein NosL [Rhodospirillum sp.]
MRIQLIALSLAVVLSLAACDDGQNQAEAPSPEEPTREAMTYFGRMILVDHLGPKAQIHLKSQDAPLWFPSVRDAKAFTLLPGEPRDITAIHVTDMAASTDWDHPRVWALAATMLYVIDANVRGGMGAPEAVPFGDKEAAERFMANHGGRVVEWDGIPEDYVLGEVPDEGEMPMMHPMHQGSLCLAPHEEVASVSTEETKP